MIEVRIIETKRQGYCVEVEVIKAGSYGTAARFKTNDEYAAADVANYIDAILKAAVGTIQGVNVLSVKFGWIVSTRISGNEFTAFYPLKEQADEVAVFVNEILRIAALP